MIKIAKRLQGALGKCFPKSNSYNALMTFVVIQTLSWSMHMFCMSLFTRLSACSVKGKTIENNAGNGEHIKHFSFTKELHVIKEIAGWILWSLNFWCVYINSILSAYNILILDFFVSIYQYVSANPNWMMQGLISCALISFDLIWLQEFIQIVKFKE